MGWNSAARVWFHGVDRTKEELAKAEWRLLSPRSPQGTAQRSGRCWRGTGLGERDI